MVADGMMLVYSCYELMVVDGSRYESTRICEACEAAQARSKLQSLIMHELGNALDKGKGKK